MKKIFFFLPVLAMVAMLASCSEKDAKVIGKNYESWLTATPASQKISQTGTASVTFQLNVVNRNKEVQDVKYYTAEISIEATNGTVSPTAVTTDETGKFTVVFTATDLENFAGGTVKATVKRLKGGREDIYQQGNLSTTTAEILPLNAEDPTDIIDEGLKKANQLNDNEFVIDGKKQTIGGWEDDYVVYGVKEDNEDHRVLYVDFTREHPENSSVSGGMIHIVPELLGQEIDLLTNENNQVFAQLWTLKDVNQGYNSETNPEVSLSTYRDKENLAKATMKFTQDPQTGACSALVYMKTKDGQEAYCKIKATTSDPWQVQ